MAGYRRNDCYAERKAVAMIIVSQTRKKSVMIVSEKGKRFRGYFDVGNEGDDDTVIRKKYGPHRDAEGGQVSGVVSIIRGGVRDGS